MHCFKRHQITIHCDFYRYSLFELILLKFKCLVKSNKVKTLNLYNKHVMLKLNFSFKIIFFRTLWPNEHHERGHVEQVSKRRLDQTRLLSSLILLLPIRVRLVSTSFKTGVSNSNIYVGNILVKKQLTGRTNKKCLRELQYEVKVL